LVYLSPFLFRICKQEEERRRRGLSSALPLPKNAITPQNARILFLAPTAIVGRARIRNKELNATANTQARRIETSPSRHSAACLNIAAVSSSISLSAYNHVREAAMIFWKDGGEHK
jgi:hypothetical protein